MNNLEKPIRFQKPELSLSALWGILFVLLSAGVVILVMIYAIGTGGAFVVACLIFGMFLLLTVRAMARSRYIYVDQDTIKIRYRLKMQKDFEIRISDCKAFFPYWYHFVTFKYSSGNMYGVILVLPDASLLVLRQDDRRGIGEVVWPQAVHGLIEILKAKQVQNLNKHDDYGMPGEGFSMSFRSREYKAFEASLIFSKHRQ